MPFSPARLTPIDLTAGPKALTPGALIREDETIRETEDRSAIPTLY